LKSFFYLYLKTFLKQFNSNFKNKIKK